MSFYRQSVGEVENLNHKEEKSVIKYESKIPRYHEYVEKEESRKVSFNLSKFNLGMKNRYSYISEKQRQVLWGQLHFLLLSISKMWLRY